MSAENPSSNGQDPMLSLAPESRAFLQGLSDEMNTHPMAQAERIVEDAAREAAAHDMAGLALHQAVENIQEEPSDAAEAAQRIVDEAMIPERTVGIQAEQALTAAALNVVGENLEAGAAQDVRRIQEERARDRARAAAQGQATNRASAQQRQAAKQDFRRRLEGAKPDLSQYKK